MRYLSIDIEATGLNENDLIIEFGMVPFCADRAEVAEDLSWHTFIRCPSFEELRPKLDTWVIEHNRELIQKAHREGIGLGQLKLELEKYLASKPVKDYFGDEKITLFGKSLSAIDLPFLNRDLGFDWMRNYFQHRQLDLSGVVHYLVDKKILPPECIRGSELSKHLGFGEVAHTALEDARNTALMYLEILRR